MKIKFMSKEHIKNMSHKLMNFYIKGLLKIKKGE